MKRVLLILFLLLPLLSCTPNGKRTEPGSTVADIKSSLPASEQRQPILHLSFVGDIMAHDVNLNRPPYSNIYHRVAPILTSDDLSFGNLEFPIAPELPVSNYPLFNVHPPYVEAAVEAGFDVFSVANNHITDQKTEGIVSTYYSLTTLQSEHEIFFSGISTEKHTSFEPVLIEKNGWKIGFIAATEFLNNTVGSEYVTVVSLKDEAVKNRFIDALSNNSKAYDLFIVSFHCGREYERIPHIEKLLFFYDLLDAGADIVWSHHPHVLQPWFTVVRGNRKKLILSSCGNFISGQTWRLDPKNPDKDRVHTGESAIFRVTVGKLNGKTTILKTSPYIIFNYRHPEMGMIVSSFDHLMNDDTLSDEWRDFYRGRWLDIVDITAEAGIHQLMEE